MSALATRRIGARVVGRCARAGLALLAGGAFAAALAAPSIEVTPKEALEGERVVVRIAGLAPGENVTLHASRMWDRYPVGVEAYRGRASFAAAADGSIDTGTTPTAAGSSYDGADAAGLFWSMAPARRDASGAHRAATLGLGDPAALGSGEVLLELESAGRIVARAEAKLRVLGPGVSVREVREAGVVGVLAQGPSDQSRPAVLVLGGSEGGLFTARAIAPLLASHGYAVLGVGYFRGGETDLAPLPVSLEQVPLETLEVARRWLLAQPGVAANRLAVVGISKGAELALVAAATYPWVDAVAAFAPSHVVWEGVPVGRTGRGSGSSWTRAGRPLPFVPWSVAAEERGDRDRQVTGSSRLTDVHLESLAEAGAHVAPAAIAIERSRAAMLLVAGIDDAMWPSAHAAAQLHARLRAAGYARPVQLEYATTGHQVLGTGWAPTTAFQRTAGRLQGGAPALDAAAQARTWAALLAFLSAHLGGRAS